MDNYPKPPESLLSATEWSVMPDIPSLLAKAFLTAEATESNSWRQSCQADCESILRTCLLFLASRPDFASEEPFNFKTIVEKTLDQLQRAQDPVPDNIQRQLEDQLDTLSDEELADPAALHTKLRLLQTTPQPLIRQLEEYVFKRHIDTDPLLSEAYTRLIANL